MLLAPPHRRIGWSTGGVLHHGVFVHVSLPQYLLLLLKSVEMIEGARRRVVIISCYYFHACSSHAGAGQAVCPDKVGAGSL